MEHDTKQKILETSRTLFYENGYINTPVRQIADAAGISTSVLFHHFINKKDIFVHIMREYLNELKKVMDLFHDDLSSIDKTVLYPKIQLHAAMNDGKLARLLVDAFNENIFAASDVKSSGSPQLDFYMDTAHYEDKTYVYDELKKFRYYFYKGVAREIMSDFFNGAIPFNKKNIDHHLVSCYNLFLNKPIDELSASIKRADRIINLLSFNGLNISVLNDKISEYIAANKKYSIFDHCKVVFVNDIVFYNVNTSDSGENETDNNIKWLKDKYDKVIALIKYYKLNSPVDIKGIFYSIDDFNSHVFGCYSALKDKFTNEFFAASFIDNIKTEEQNGIINQFEKYGIDAIKTLRNLNIHHDGDDNVIEQCAFVFY